jgi:alpha-1,6-mannosyltransferase
MHLILVRLTLAGFVAFSWSRLKTTLQQKLGIDVGTFFTIITLSQFHFIFYMSRPLPNIMALPLVMLSLNSWLRREQKRFLLFAGASIFIFRSELVILLGLLLIYDLFYKRMTITELLKAGIPIGVGLIALTVTIDSFFWQRLLWPEAEVLWFNTVLNKSSDWGTSPFLWYFYSALPRALGLSLFFVPYGLYVEPRIRATTISAIVFILLYSFLPHKELRFIVYSFPMLNIASSCACHRLWINRNKSALQTILALVAVGHLLGNFLLTVFLLTVSGTNYPGGVAMSRLHRIAPPDANISIHIDNLAAQSGVTRFTEINVNWTYSKDEHLKAGDEELHKFDFLLAEVKNRYSPEMRILQQTHEKIELVECFSNIGVHYSSLLPLKIRTKPCIMILKRKPNAVLLKRFFSVDENLEEEELSGEGSTKVIEGSSEDQEEEEEEEIVEEEPKVLKRKRLRSSVLRPKSKIREIIEAQRLEELAAALRAEEEEEELSAKDEESNELKRAEAEEKRQKLSDQLSKLDLSAFCDLTIVDTKECLKQILIENDLD